MFWLWALTLFSASTAAVTGVGWWVTWYKLDRERWQNEQAEKARHTHYCAEHSGLFNAAEATERARDLTAIRKRWEEPFRNRVD